MTCPLHHGQNVAVVETLRSRHIARAYRRRFRVEAASAFEGIDTIAFCRCTECGLGFFAPPVAGGEKFYAQLSRFDWYYPRDKAEYSFARTYIGGADAVLEVGSGDGAFADGLSKATYVGLELNPDAIKAARAKGLQVQDEPVERYALTHSQHFDVVCAFQVLEHIVKPTTFVAACLDCLRPGGLLILAVPNTEAYIKTESDNILNMPPHHVTWWSETSFKHLAKRFGLDIVAVDKETLAADHRRIFLRAIILRSISRAFGVKRQFVIGGLLYRSTQLAARALARFLLLGFDDPGQMPHGHTITVVLRKPLGNKPMA